jgi:UDP-glucuronate 4-epimerase
MNERFLVTGAYGCIGAWVLRQLVDEGADVVAADASTDDHRVTALLDEDERSRVRFVQADISRPEEVEVLFCRADPVRGAQVNVVGTVAIFTSAMQGGLSTPIVYASSAAAFAAADAGLDPSGHPATHYGVYKLANEETARVFAAENGVSSIGLRPYVVYGPGRDQGLTSQPTMAMRAAAKGKAFTIGYSGVTQLQYGADAAAAFVAAARIPYDGAAVVNLPGVTASVDDIVEAIVQVVPDAEIDVDGSQLPFPPELDTSPFTKIVGELPLTPLADGVAATIAHFR